MLRPTPVGISTRSTKSRRRTVFLPIAVGALLTALGGAGASAAPPGEADASNVSHWNQVAATTLAAFPGPNGGAPPAFQINMGMVQGAVYDAVNAIGPKQHQPYLLNSARARRRRSTLRSQRRHTTCSRSWSRPRRSEPRSRVARDS